MAVMLTMLFWLVAGWLFRTFQRAHDDRILYQANAQAALRRRIYSGKGRRGA